LLFFNYFLSKSWSISVDCGVFASCWFFCDFSDYFMNFSSLFCEVFIVTSLFGDVPIYTIFVFICYFLSFFDVIIIFYYLWVFYEYFNDFSDYFTCLFHRNPFINHYLLIYYFYLNFAISLSILNGFLYFLFWFLRKIILEF